MNSPTPLDTSGTVNSLPSGSFLTSKRWRETYALQVQAFLDASDEVDMDEEIAEDILEGFDGYLDDNEEGDVDIGNYTKPSNTLDANIHHDGGSEDDRDPRLDALEYEAMHAWSPQEIRGMMHHLKEYGVNSFINEYVMVRTIPIPKILYAFGVCLSQELRTKRPKTLLYFLKVILSRELCRREKLPQYNTITDAVDLIRQSQHIVILTGAGISVSCGIPDFRSRNGLYASLKETGEFDLDDPQQMFDIQYFKENPSGAIFCSKITVTADWVALYVSILLFCKIYPSNFIPSPCHRFIKLIEDKGKLLRNYTQNIDTLETLAGVSRVLQCHGSFATASCINCRRRVAGSEIETDIQNQRVPVCPVCKALSSKPALVRKKRGKKKNGWDSAESDESEEPDFPPGIMKPDITFFGEKLTDNFDTALLEDQHKVDLLLVIGTSLNVAPVSDVVSHLPHSVPQILINKTPVKHMNPDIVMLGNADDVVHHLCSQLGWALPQPPPPSSTSITSKLTPLINTNKRSSAEIVDRQEPRRVGDSHVWLFEGAEGGLWVQQVEDNLEMNPGGSRNQIPNEREAKKLRVS